MEVPVWAALVAAVPIVVLAALVLAPRVELATAAWLVAAGTAGLALTVYGMTPFGLAVGAAKGLWTGLWILALVVPALLLFQVAESAGAFDRLAEALRPVAPTPGRRLLLLGWVFPSFLQGVAGFGLPVVVAAPMLVRLGVTPVAAVAACLVGYHWAVTFGSMGSSFFVAAATAQLDAASTQAFALQAAALLAVNGLAAGLLVLRRSGRGWSEAAASAVVLAAVMGVVLIATVAVQPALGSTAAGLAGLMVAAALLPRRGSRPSWSPILVAAAPYLLLTVLVVTAFGVPALRSVAGQVPQVAPFFPDTTAAFGHVNAPVFEHQPFRPLQHPGPYLLVAAVTGWALYRRLGWQASVPTPVLRTWWARSLKTGGSLLGLTTLAGVMVDAGMMSAMAQALGTGLGVAYLAVAPAVGALGTATAGSSTASNALLAPLQAGAAERLGFPATALLAAQATGSNVGNTLAPLNVLVAAVAAGASGRERDIIRSVLPDTLLLLVLLTAGVLLLARLA